LFPISEGKLNVLIDNRRRFAERYVYLFDGMIIICKINRKTGSALGVVGVGGSGGGSPSKKKTQPSSLIGACVFFFKKHFL